MTALHTRKQPTRSPYRNSREFDGSCRCHGGCPWCASSRTRKRRAADAELRAARKALPIGLVLVAGGAR